MSPITRTSVAALCLALGLPAVAQETAAPEGTATPETAAPEAAAPEAAEGTDAPAPAGEAAAESATPSVSVDAETVLATVGDQSVTVGHVIALVAELPEQYQQLPDEVLFPGVLEQMIQQLVLSQTYDSATPAEQLTIDNQERALEAGIAVQRILNEPVDEAALQAAYDSLYADAEPEREFDASHILVETQEEAQAIADEIASGGDFAAIAKEKSTDPGSGANGGELGWFGLGMMVPEFETAVVGMDEGEISDPVQSQFGWHVIKLNAVRTKDAPSLDELRPQLEEQLKNQKVEEAIAAATDSANIDRMDLTGIDPAVIHDMDLIQN